MNYSFVFWLVTIILAVWLSLAIEDIIENHNRKKRDKLFSEIESKRLNEVINDVR